MNSAAVLALDRIGFNSHFIFLGGTDPWSVHQLFRQVPWGAHAPVATLQHRFNLQAHFPSVKESGACASCQPSNSCNSGEHLLTVRMRSHPAWDGSKLCVISSRKKLRLPWVSPSCSPACLCLSRPNSFAKMPLCLRRMFPRGPLLKTQLQPRPLQRRHDFPRKCS